MRGGMRINSYSEEEREIEASEKLSPMISQFAKSVIPQNAVDQARARNAQSFMQQLTSIMTNKPRYATVDDAVKDMQERTGLTLHLENIKSAKKKVNKQANDTGEESYLLGLEDGKFDLKKDQVGDILASMTAHRYPRRGIIAAKPMEYALGYAEGSDWVKNKGKDTLDYELNKIKSAINQYGTFAAWIDKLDKIHGIKQAQISTQNEIPEFLSKYDFANDVVSYIHNNIHNTGGLGVSVPSVQHDILSVFPKINPTDIMNEQVSKYISDCIYDEQKMHTAPPATNNLGMNVGKDLITQDPDPWLGLIPAK
jgi:hypothetical protein